MTIRKLDYGGVKMRKNDFIEQRSINIIKGIFLDNSLKSYLSENDKTEFIDGCVYVENNIKNFNIDIGKIEIQVKGRTNKKTVSVKKSFIEYCRSNVSPVVIFLVEFNDDSTLKKICLKYIDKYFKVDDIEAPKISFSDGDIITSEMIQSKLIDITNRHWTNIVSNINEPNNKRINIEMYSFMNDVIRGVNGVIFTVFNRYMDKYFSNVSRFAIIYSGDQESGLSYSIIPILKGTISNDIINVDKSISILKWGTGTIYSQGIKLNGVFVNKLIINILKKAIIPSIINEETFSKLNSIMTKRSLIYTLHRVFDKVKRKQNEYNSNYIDEIKKIMDSSKKEFTKSEIMLIANANIDLITEKHNKDFFELIEKLNLEKNYSMQSEYDDSKVNMVVKDGKRVIKIIKKSKFIYLSELLKVMDDKDIISLDEYLNIDAFFKNGDFNEKVKYVKLKYDCICEFFGKYTNIYPRTFEWNVEHNSTDKFKEYVRGGVEYSKVLASNEWKSILDESLDCKSWSKLIFENENYLTLSQTEFPCSRKMNFDFEPLVMDIYEESNSIIYAFIDDCLKNVEY